MSNQPDLSIIILSYKMDGLVKNCLKSLFEHVYQSQIEVIVVDNDSRDNCEEIVRSQFPTVKFIQTGKNYGHAKGNNIGIKESTGRYIMLLNPDIVFLKPIIDELVDFLDKNRKIGITTVQLTNPDGSLQPGAWRFHRFLTPLYQRSSYLQRRSFVKRHIARFHMSDWDRSDSREVDWVQGSCLVARREAIDRIGLLDERFFLYFTDVDWCRRCWEAGWSVYYLSDVNVIHYYNRESARKFGIRSLTNKATQIHIKDWVRYLFKYRKNLHRS